MWKNNNLWKTLFFYDTLIEPNNIERGEKEWKKSKHSGDAFFS